MLTFHGRGLWAAVPEPRRPDAGKEKERPIGGQGEPRRGLARLGVLMLAK